MDEINQLKTEAISFATSHSLNIVSKESATAFIHAPFSLTPQPLQAKLFAQGQRIAPIFNKLVDAIARDETGWLEKVLKHTVVSDEFTAKLLEIHLRAEKERRRGKKWQETALGVLRSDYMKDEKNDLLQVELNTIAASFGCLSGKVSKLHKFLYERHGEQFTKAMGKSKNEEIQIPENNAKPNIAKAIAHAVGGFEDDTGIKNTKIVFVVQEGERNAFDQRLLEYEIFSRFKIPVLRRTMREIHEQGKLNADNVLHLNGQPISVAYFRAGYTPNDYKTEVEWEARWLIESSYTIKCPNIAYHLAGTKKVQQVLARPNELEKFLTKEECLELQDVFTGLYSLDKGEQTVEDIEAEKSCMNGSTKYVLKPQREGGGNNFYGANVGERLKTLTQAEKECFILMKRIYPVDEEVVLVKNSEVVTGKGICELGVFGVIVSDGKNTSLNEYAGYLLRTKLTETDEGGVATGYSCLSSVHITP